MTKTIPLVSICCITYNHEPFIRECLDGFFMQQGVDFEILIHDDASTDGTQDVIREYMERYPGVIKPIFQTENQWSQGIRGMNPRFNFSRASGKYIAMCEGDDYWTDPLKLQKQVGFLETNEDYILTGHNASFLNDQGQIFKSYFSENFASRDVQRAEIKKGFYIPTGSLVFRKIKYEIPSILKNVVNGDTILLHLLSEKGRIRIFNDVSPSIYRIHDGGIWSKVGQASKVKMRKTTYKKFKEFYKNDPDLYEFYKKKYKDTSRKTLSFLDQSDSLSSYLDDLFFYLRHNLSSLLSSPREIKKFLRQNFYFWKNQLS